MNQREIPLYKRGNKENTYFSAKPKLMCVETIQEAESEAIPMPLSFKRNGDVDLN
jgi:hypothetical protein